MPPALLGALLVARLIQRAQLAGCEARIGIAPVGQEIPRRRVGLSQLRGVPTGLDHTARGAVGGEERIGGRTQAGMLDAGHEDGRTASLTRGNLSHDQPEAREVLQRRDLILDRSASFQIIRLQCSRVQLDRCLETIQRLGVEGGIGIQNLVVEARTWIVITR